MWNSLKMITRVLRISLFEVVFTYIWNKNHINVHSCEWNFPAWTFDLFDLNNLIMFIETTLIFWVFSSAWYCKSSIYGWEYPYTCRSKCWWLFIRVFLPIDIQSMLFEYLLSHTYYSHILLFEIWNWALKTYYLNFYLSYKFIRVQNKNIRSISKG